MTYSKAQLTAAARSVGYVVPALASTAPTFSDMTVTSVSGVLRELSLFMLDPPERAEMKRLLVRMYLGIHALSAVFGIPLEPDSDDFYKATEGVNDLVACENLVEDLLKTTRAKTPGNAAYCLNWALASVRKLGSNHYTDVGAKAAEAMAAASAKAEA